MEIRALSRVKANGVRFLPGDLITGIDEKIASRLLEKGAAELVFSESEGEFVGFKDAKEVNVEEIIDETPMDVDEKRKVNNQEESKSKREVLEDEYRALGGRPSDGWTIEKLMSKLEERRGRNK
ncbi:hypothetical protein [Acetomicrobium sp. S15 = DSM 107314]|uniref:hypothetical protein n=1 Tax=Acetomicrobium sp. S15 = DSM 107314 TaxID=2529858 RepID=UPI0018E1778A|nr:hypothetical protein [Acetomicrobium sp. S15 = DSM 107314]